MLEIIEYMIDEILQAKVLKGLVAPKVISCYIIRLGLARRELV